MTAIAVRQSGGANIVSIPKAIIKTLGLRVGSKLDMSIKDNKIVFTADSDAILTKGIISLLLRVYSNQSPKDILDAEPFFIDEIGLKEHLSPTRANGLVSMVKQLKLYALAYQTKYS